MSEGGRAEELKHPDCRWCEESLRVNLGLMEENRQLTRALSEDLSRLSTKTRTAVTKVMVDTLCLDPEVKAAILASAQIPSGRSGEGTG